MILVLYIAIGFASMLALIYYCLYLNKEKRRPNIHDLRIGQKVFVHQYTVGSVKPGEPEWLKLLELPILGLTLNDVILEWEGRQTPVNNVFFDPEEAKRTRVLDPTEVVSQIKTSPPKKNREEAPAKTKKPRAKRIKP